MKKSIISVLLLCLLASNSLVFIGNVSAEESEQQTEQQVLITTQEDTTSKKQTIRETIKTRLEGKKLAACKKRETGINNTLARIVDRDTKRLAVFTKIADRVKAFYAEKGYSLANYAELVAEVDAKQSAAVASIETISSTNITFACDGSDPKNIVSTFKNIRSAETIALKEYKTAIKNLIVGVKSAQSTADTSDEGSTEGSDTTNNDNATGENQ